MQRYQQGWQRRMPTSEDSIYKPQVIRLTKIRIQSVSVASVLVYLSEICPLTETQMIKVDDIQKKHLRKIEHVKWFNKVQNLEILLSFRLSSLSEQLEACLLHRYGYLLHLPVQTPARLISNFDPSANGRNFPEVDHAQDGRTSSAVDSLPGTLTLMKLQPSPRT